jgi:hypothetical protein
LQPEGQRDELRPARARRTGNPCLTLTFPLRIARINAAIKDLENIMKKLIAAAAAALFVSGAALAQTSTTTPSTTPSGPGATGGYQGATGTDTTGTTGTTTTTPKTHRKHASTHHNRHHKTTGSSSSASSADTGAYGGTAPVRGGSATPGPGSPMGNNLSGATNQGTASAPSNSTGVQR